MKKNNMMSLIEFFNIHRRPRSCKKTNRYGAEVIRINNNARTQLQRMFDVTRIPKRSLASYAIFMLNEEFEKWLKCDQETKFGYDGGEVDAEPK